MGEIIAAAFLIVFAILAISFGVPYALKVVRQQDALQRAPVTALEQGGGTVTQMRSLHYYKVGQEAVRHLERILQEDELLPRLSVEERKAIQVTINKFYDV